MWYEMSFNTNKKFEKQICLKNNVNNRPWAHSQNKKEQKEYASSQIYSVLPLLEALSHLNQYF